MEVVIITLPNRYTPCKWKGPLSKNGESQNQEKTKMYKLPEHSNTENDCQNLSSYFSVVQSYTFLNRSVCRDTYNSTSFY